MPTAQIIECYLNFKFKSKEERCQRPFPKGAKILKNNTDHNPLKIFAFYEGVINGHRENITFLLIKQDKSITEISKDVKVEAKEHLRTFTNEHGTFHLFKLNQE